ncbi:MAG TPA: cytochrome d ubiquinol oxidase subunit II, partial [Gemmatimonadales bacterium]|nr:cytochrome d ubiquinol oxidase subunit II [Gemmatimonadales bacterium]
LREDFRLRGIGAGIAVGVAALVVLLLAGSWAPGMQEGLLHSSWSVPLQLATVAVAGTAIAALRVRRWRLARTAAVAEVTLLLWGWGLGQYPYFVPPYLTVADTAAPQATLEGVTLALVLGGVVLIPSLVYLFRVFKSARTTESP